MRRRRYFVMPASVIFLAKLYCMLPLLTLYKSRFGCAPAKVEKLAKAGSNREYVRLLAADGSSVIGVMGPSAKENDCFVYLARHFSERQLPVPEVYAVSDDVSCYLQEDLGRCSLYDAIAAGRQAEGQYNETEVELLCRTIRLLPHVQVEGADGLDFNRCLAPVVFDAAAAMFDLNYFKYCFLRTTDVPFDEVLLEKDLQHFAADLEACADAPGATFLYRDFQARNVMLKGGCAPAFIDFQGGMCGPLQYDVASFLWQASARYPQTLRESLVDEYLDELVGLLPALDPELFRLRLRLFVLFRILQVLGAYGLRGYFERKKYFVDSIPPAIQNLRRQLLDGVCVAYPYLEQTLQMLVNLPQFNPAPLPAIGTASTSQYDGRGPLVVRVFSFSYKKGIPADTTGNGGGYVFDCRSTHNPGRYEPYKKITGLDPAVIKFLEDDGEILPFLDHATQLVDAHVERYIKRGFTDLQVSFGCTGGQHRSVYSANRLAEHINEKYGVEVRLCHREQGIEKTLAARKCGC